MPLRVTHHVLNPTEINRLLRGPQGGVTRNLLRRGLRVETAAKRLVKADHGRLRQSITHQVHQTPNGPSVRIGTNVSYALAVHNGTGVYGPKGTPIRPKVKSVLRFTSRGGQIVFTRYVRGQRANPFLRSALRAAGG